MRGCSDRAAVCEYAVKGGNQVLMKLALMN